ncbi:spore protease YyaC [Paenibacillus sp. strain BS8-2]
MTISKAAALPDEETSTERLRGFVSSIASKQPDKQRIVFVCIGTDRSTGDALGPLVGTMLKEHGWPRVIGTLAEPCDAHKVEGVAANIPVPAADGTIIIAIDACLGKPQSIGGYVLSSGPIRPGAATGGGLPPIGDFGIAGVVNRHGPKAYFLLQTTSLHLVMEMAKQIVSEINEAWYIHS